MRAKFVDYSRKTMAKRKKARRITPEEQAEFDRHVKAFSQRIAEREAIDRAAAEAARKSA